MPREAYRPLLAYLATLPPEQTAVTLPLTEIAALCGPLSVSAHTSGPYWRAVSRSVYWRSSSWSARLNYVVRSLTFTRRQLDARP